MLNEEQVRELLNDAIERRESGELSEIFIHYFDGLIRAYQNVLDVEK